VTITTYVQYHRAINGQHDKQTLLSFICNIATDRKLYGREIVYEHFQPIVRNLATLLLCHGADSERGYNDDYSWKAIHHACFTGNVTLVQLLLEHHRHTSHGASIDRILRYEPIRKGNCQRTAFHIIDRKIEHFIPIVKMLIQYGADINSRDSDGNTGLHTVLLEKDYYNIKYKDPIVQFFLDDCHADYITIKNKDGQTVWDIARKQQDSSFNIMERK
jgi:ankyrin repeat protein